MSKIQNWRTDPRMQALKAICLDQGFKGMVTVGFRVNGDIESFSYGVDGPWCDAVGEIGGNIVNGLGSGTIETTALGPLLR
jgi:hypothetical protein